MARPRAIKREQALWMLRKMRTIRQVSERIVELYPTDVMESPIHLCTGQEAVSVGLCCHLRDTDTLFLGHRTQGPALSKGLPLPKMMAELYGRTTGCSRANGGSMHLFDLEHGIPGTSAIVGGNIALGVGAALSAKIRGSDAISVSYFGDAATNAGVYYESLNFAALNQLPVLFLCENNGLSITMPIEKHSFVGMTAVAEQFMPVSCADGTDALDVYCAAGAAVEMVRSTGKPAFLECKTKRWMKHHGHEVDDLSYNPIDRDVDCPIRKLESFMLSSKLITKRGIGDLVGEIEAEIDAAIVFAEASPYPETTITSNPS